MRRLPIRHALASAALTMAVVGGAGVGLSAARADEATPTEPTDPTSQVDVTELPTDATDDPGYGTGGCYAYDPGATDTGDPVVEDPGTSEQPPGDEPTEETVAEGPVSDEETDEPTDEPTDDPSATMWVCPEAAGGAGGTDDPAAGETTATAQPAGVAANRGGTQPAVIPTRITSGLAGENGPTGDGVRTPLLALSALLALAGALGLRRRTADRT